MRFYYSFFSTNINKCVYIYNLVFISRIITIIENKIKLHHLNATPFFKIAVVDLV